MPNTGPDRQAELRPRVEHVVIIVQENRSFDDLFNGFRGANTAHWGLNSRDKKVALVPVDLTAPYRVGHTHRNFLIEYNGGKLNGWNLAASGCAHGQTCPPAGKRIYGYVPQNEVQPYWTMASEYALADNMFQTNQGPSFPAHQYLVSGTSSIATGSSLVADGNPSGPGVGGGCDSQRRDSVTVINELTGKRSGSVFPCFNRLSLMDKINQTSLTWAYYQEQPGAGLWHGPDAIQGIWSNPNYNTWVKTPSSRVLTDIANGNLANIVWVTPSDKESDHAGSTDGTGPDWVASVVNAIGQSQYWSNTVIFVTWDDWGGWYDHVAPKQFNHYELGFRVPLLAISPYARNGYISSTQHEFGSILKFTEEAFSLPSLGTTDVRADDLSDMFNWKQSPTPFRPIPTLHSAGYFESIPDDHKSPDDDD